MGISGNLDADESRRFEQKETGQMMLVTKNADILQTSINPGFPPKVRKADGWKVGESSPQGADEPYVGSHAALLSEPNS